MVVIEVVVVNLDIICCCCVGIIHGDHLVPWKFMCGVVDVVPCGRVVVMLLLLLLMLL